MTDAEKALLQDIDLDCAVNWQHLVNQRPMIHDALKQAYADRDSWMERALAAERDMIAAEGTSGVCHVCANGSACDLIHKLSDRSCFVWRGFTTDGGDRQ